MTDEEYVMSLAKVKFEQKWDNKTLAKELGVSYIWTMVILGRRREITRNIAKKIETLLKKYNCEPWKEPK